MTVEIDNQVLQTESLDAIRASLESIEQHLASIADVLRRQYKNREADAERAELRKAAKEAGLL